MKIRVRHKETEFVVEDDAPRTDTHYNMIHYNESFIYQVLKEITEHIIAINKEQEE